MIKDILLELYELIANFVIKAAYNLPFINYSNIG